MDMKSPGVEVRPLVNLAGQHGFNEVFFDNVRVPKENLVGEENRGWYVGVTLLDFERSNISGAAAARREFEKLLRHLGEHKNGGPNPQLKHKLAEMAIEIEVGRGMSYRVASIQNRGQVPNYEASMAKLYHSEVGVRLARLGTQVLGAYGQLRPESKHAMIDGDFTMSYMTSLGGTIAAGTSEIQRGIIAGRGLGLPRV
jgi:3-oxocholest-4-en-26-oyl-CoA dehydrogenase alpha subunit